MLVIQKESTDKLRTSTDVATDHTFLGPYFQVSKFNFYVHEDLLFILESLEFVRALSLQSLVSDRGLNALLLRQKLANSVHVLKAASPQTFAI